MSNIIFYIKICQNSLILSEIIAEYVPKQVWKKIKRKQKSDMKAKSITSTSITSKIEKFHPFLFADILLKLYVFNPSKHEFHIFWSPYLASFLCSHV